MDDHSTIVVQTPLVAHDSSLKNNSHTLSCRPSGLSLGSMQDNQLVPDPHQSQQSTAHLTERGAQQLSDSDDQQQQQQQQLQQLTEDQETTAPRRHVQGDAYSTGNKLYVNTSMVALRFPIARSGVSHPHHRAIGSSATEEPATAATICAVPTTIRGSGLDSDALGTQSARSLRQPGDQILSAPGAGCTHPRNMLENVPVRGDEGPTLASPGAPPDSAKPKRPLSSITLSSLDPKKKFMMSQPSDRGPRTPTTYSGASEKRIGSATEASKDTSIATTVKSPASHTSDSTTEQRKQLDNRKTVVNVEMHDEDDAEDDDNKPLSSLSSRPKLGSKIQSPELTKLFSSSGMKYHAVVGHEPQNGDEIALSIGDDITVIKEYDDGWALAFNKNSTKLGLVPMNFLKRRRPKSVGAALISAASSRKEMETSSSVAPTKITTTDQQSLGLDAEKPREKDSQATSHSGGMMMVGCGKVTSSANNSSVAGTKNDDGKNVAAVSSGSRALAFTSPTLFSSSESATTSSMHYVEKIAESGMAVPSETITESRTPDTNKNIILENSYGSNNTDISHQRRPSVENQESIQKGSSVATITPVTSVSEELGSGAHIPVAKQLRPMTDVDTKQVPNVEISSAETQNEPVDMNAERGRPRTQSRNSSRATTNRRKSSSINIRTIGDQTSGGESETAVKSRIGGMLERAEHVHDQPQSPTVDEEPHIIQDVICKTTKITQTQGSMNNANADETTSAAATTIATSVVEMTTISPYLPSLGIRPFSTYLPNQFPDAHIKTELEAQRETAEDISPSQDEAQGDSTPAQLTQSDNNDGFSPLADNGSPNTVLVYSLPSTRAGVVVNVGNEQQEEKPEIVAAIMPKTMRPKKKLKAGGSRNSIRANYMYMPPSSPDGSSNRNNGSEQQNKAPEEGTREEPQEESVHEIVLSQLTKDDNQPTNSDAADSRHVVQTMLVRSPYVDLMRNLSVLNQHLQSVITSPVDSLRRAEVAASKSGIEHSNRMALIRELNELISSPAVKECITDLIADSLPEDATALAAAVANNPAISIESMPHESDTGANVAISPASPNIAESEPTAPPRVRSRRTPTDRAITRESTTVPNHALADDSTVARVRSKKAHIDTALMIASRTIDALGCIRITFAGDSGIGKTSLIKSLLAAPEFTVMESRTVTVHGALSSSSYLSSMMAASAAEACTSPLEAPENEDSSLPSQVGSDAKSDPPKEKRQTVSATVVEYCAATMSERMREYLTGADPSVKHTPGGAIVALARPPFVALSGAQHNVELVDTPGFGSRVNALDTIVPVVWYHSRMLKSTARLFSPTASRATVARYLSGCSGMSPYVDACVYCILHRVKRVDTEYMRRLSSVATVIPVLLKSDTMDRATAFRLKTQVLRAVRDAGINIFTGGLTVDELIVLAEAGVSGAVPFVVSSRLAATTDAGSPQSSMMSSVQPEKALNELDDMRSALFTLYPDMVRNAAAARYMAWSERRELAAAARAAAADAQARAMAAAAASAPPAGDVARAADGSPAATSAQQDLGTGGTHTPATPKGASSNGSPVRREGTHGVAKLRAAIRDAVGGSPGRSNAAGQRRRINSTASSGEFFVADFGAGVPTTVTGTAGTTGAPAPAAASGGGGGGGGVPVALPAAVPVAAPQFEPPAEHVAAAAHAGPHPPGTVRRGMAAAASAPSLPAQGTHGSRARLGLFRR